MPRQRASILPLTACLFLLLRPSNASSSPSTIFSRAVQEKQALCNARLNKNGECGFQGNPDMYGLGLRLGIYLQWLACNLSLTFVAHPEKDLPDASLVYSVAIALAIILVTFQDTCVYFVEAFMLINIAFGGTLHLDLTKWEKGGWRRPALLLFYLVIFPYSCWFWRQGMPRHFQDTPCGTQLFLFGRISGGHVNTALNVFFAISIILTVVIGYSSIVQLVGSIMTRMGFEPPKGYLWHHRINDRSSKEKEVTPWTYALFTLLLAYMAYIIITIEYTLKWNNITGVNSLGSVGQFFPFIISIFNLLRVFASIYHETMRKMKIQKDVEQNCAGLISDGVELVKKAQAPDLTFHNDLGDGNGKGQSGVEIRERGTGRKSGGSGSSDGLGGDGLEITQAEGTRRSWMNP